MDLLDLMTEEEWNAFSKEMHQRYGISFGISDTKGARVSSYANWCNRLCPKIKSNPESLATVCAVAAQHFTEKTRQSGQPEIGECDLGLLKIAVPIFIGKTFLGTAGGCGYAGEQCEIDDFMVQKITGMDAAEVSELTREIASMTFSQAAEMAEDLTERIKTIVSRRQGAYQEL